MHASSSLPSIWQMLGPELGRLGHGTHQFIRFHFPLESIVDYRRLETEVALGRRQN